MLGTCFLFGHRDAPGGLLPEIEAAVERHYSDYGIRRFVVGGYGSFDGMAAAAVKALKRRHGDAALYLLLPYHPSLRPTEIPAGFDGTLYPEGMESVPPRLAIIEANRYMVKASDSIICYVSRPGNSRSLLEFARRPARREALHIENLGEKVQP